MLTGVGHQVVLYSGPACDADVAEHVVVVTDADRRRWFGDETYADRVFDRWDPADPCWTEMAQSTIAAIRERIATGDIVGLTMGLAQQLVADAFPDHVAAEMGVGYEGVLNTTHRCFESYSHMHYVYGRSGSDPDGRWFDTVIPNAFDPADYRFSTDKDDYLLYLGRMMSRKGLVVVAELAKHHRVLTAGQGDERVAGAEHLGVVTGADKADLLAGARAVLVPTIYLEPFGGVAVEAMLSGTAVITSPFGAFTETVSHGVSGFRCHTLAEFLDAARAVDGLDPKIVRDWAAARFTLDVVAPQYDRWLTRLGTLTGKGWYA